jgi:adenylosuccinate synthase
MGALIVVDALWGDPGKGKVAAYLSRRENARLCLRAGIGTNAGHSLYLSEQEVLRTRQLPLGFLHPETHVGIGSGVAVDPPGCPLQTSPVIKPIAAWRNLVEGKKLCLI